MAVVTSGHCDYLRNRISFCFESFSMRRACNRLLSLHGEGSTLSNPLCKLLELSEQEKVERGLQHTPREIWQQPETWQATYEVCKANHSAIAEVLRQAGIGRGNISSPTVYLVGAGASGYTGRGRGPPPRKRRGLGGWGGPRPPLRSEVGDYH